MRIGGDRLRLRNISRAVRIISTGARSPHLRPTACDSRARAREPRRRRSTRDHAALWSLSSRRNQNAIWFQLLKSTFEMLRGVNDQLLERRVLAQTHVEF